MYAIRKEAKRCEPLLLLVLLQVILPGSSSRLCMGAYIYIYTCTGVLRTYLGNKRLMHYFKQESFESLLAPLNL